MSTMDAETFWTLPRSTRPREALERLLPTVPPLAGMLTLALPASVHVEGSGGGAWTVGVVDGRCVVTAGAADEVSARISVSRSHLREVIGGALRDRGVELMRRLGRPMQFPDLQFLPLDPQRLVSIAQLTGSVAVEVHDRQMRDSYRFVISFGSAAAAYDVASTTVHVDADEVLEQVANGVSISALLKGSRVRIEGDISLPLKALRFAFGHDAIERRRSA